MQASAEQRAHVAGVEAVLVPESPEATRAPPRIFGPDEPSLRHPTATEIDALCPCRLGLARWFGAPPPSGSGARPLQ